MHSSLHGHIEDRRQEKGMACPTIDLIKEQTFWIDDPREQYLQ
jgi:hypothetical protein